MPPPKSLAGSKSHTGLIRAANCPPFFLPTDGGLMKATGRTRARGARRAGGGAGGGAGPDGRDAQEPEMLLGPEFRGVVARGWNLGVDADASTAITWVHERGW